MREELVSHLENLHLIYESQHGFRQGRSCLSNILTFLEKATKAVDVEFYLYPTVSTALVHSVKPELTE